MDYADTKKDLLILGVHLKTEGYPNTLYRLQDLQSSGLFRIAEINVPMWDESTQNRHGFSRLTRNIWRAVVAHIAVVIHYLIAYKRPACVYVPYPSVFVLFFLSCLPQKYRPQRIVADVFISLYDTIVLDRNLLKRDGVPARLLKWLEMRAYLSSDTLVMDTEQNARFLCSLFGLPVAKTVVIPLSTNEVHFKFTAYIPRPGICDVLFVGTLVPLHGIATILEAARLLADRSNIHFKLIGDGQDAPLVEAWLRTNVVQLEWERSWQSSERVAEEIARADICLGIFGAGGKAQRVCPFKIYAYAAMGRAIITGATNWLKEATGRLSCEPFGNVPVNDAASLATKIALLADDPMLRTKLAASGHEFYRAHLGNQLTLEKLVACLLD